MNWGTIAGLNGKPACILPVGNRISPNFGRNMIREGPWFSCDIFGGERYRVTGSFTAPGAILSYGDAQVDPFRLTHQLIQAAKKQGLRVYDRCDVSRVEPSDGGIVLSHRGRSCESGDSESYLRPVMSPSNT